MAGAAPAAPPLSKAESPERLGSPTESNRNYYLSVLVQATLSALRTCALLDNVLGAREQAGHRVQRAEQSTGDSGQTSCRSFQAVVLAENWERHLNGNRNWHDDRMLLQSFDHGNCLGDFEGLCRFDAGDLQRDGLLGHPNGSGRCTERGMIDGFDLAENRDLFGETVDQI